MQETTPRTARRRPSIIALTDDLTGQLCLASLLRNHGVRAGLDTVHDEIDIDVSVVNTRTRDVEKRTAAAAFAARVNRLGVRPGTLWAKRIDSTLRGPIRAELGALVNIVGASGGVLAPANPLAGRVTVNGEHFAHGRRIGDLTRLVRQLPGVRSVQVGGEFRGGVGTWWIPDVTQPLDVYRTAQEIPLDPRFLVVDSGALAAAVSARYCGAAAGDTRHTSQAVRPGVVVVQGSTSALVARQVARLRQHGLDNVEIFHRAIAGPSDPMLDTFVREAAARIDRQGIGLVIVGGGLTAEALLEAARMDVQDLEALPAPGPLIGLARLRAGRHTGLLVATKGGQVGRAEALVDLVASLRTAWRHKAMPELTGSH